MYLLSGGLTDRDGYRDVNSIIFNLPESETKLHEIIKYFDNLIYDIQLNLNLYSWQILTVTLLS